VSWNIYINDEADLVVIQPRTNLNVDLGFIEDFVFLENVVFRRDAAFIKDTVLINDFVPIKLTYAKRSFGTAIFKGPLRMQCSTPKFNWSRELWPSTFSRSEHLAPVLTCAE
jgi:hypothetical protein